jgi:hypothetical protein
VLRGTPQLRKHRVYYIIKSRSLFLPSPEIEDRDAVEVATGRSTKKSSTLNDIQCGTKVTQQFDKS